MERDTQDVNYELRLLTTLDVFDDNIWIEPEPSGKLIKEKTKKGYVEK